MSKQWRIVRETIDHGEHTAERFVATDLTTESVEAMLNSCSYLKLATFDEDDESIILTSSSTNDEIRAARIADAARVAKELAETGDSEIGWVRYHVSAWIGSEQEAKAMTERRA